MLTLKELILRDAKNGQLEWIGVRPARNIEMVTLEEVKITEKGLDGDRATKPNDRSVTLMQAEHINAIASMVKTQVDGPAGFRRNLIISGINLLTLKDQVFCIGSVVLKGTGICAPCSKMEKWLGFGGYNAMRGHGGITAKVIETGTIQLGDEVKRPKAIDDNQT